MCRSNKLGEYIFDIFFQIKTKEKQKLDLLNQTHVDREERGKMKENRRIEKERVVDAAESNENKLSVAIYLKTREREREKKEMR